MKHQGEWNSANPMLVCRKRFHYFRFQSLTLGMNDNPKRRASATNWNEADTCRKFVVPKLQAVGWDNNDPHSIAEQRTFTEGPIVVCGSPAQWQKDNFVNIKQQSNAVFKFSAQETRGILDGLLKKCASDVERQFALPDVLKFRPISDHGNVNEIIGKFGGADQLRTAVSQLQSLLYAA